MKDKLAELKSVLLEVADRLERAFSAFDVATRDNRVETYDCSDVCDIADKLRDEAKSMQDFIDDDGLFIVNVSDITDLIDRNLRSHDEELRKHAATLVGPRERGSRTTQSLYDVPESRIVTELLNHPSVANGCRLFQFRADMGGVMQAVPYAAASQFGDVKQRHGDHGPELYVELDDSYTTETNLISVIIGKHNGRFGEEWAVFTWHPGPPLLPYVESDLPNIHPQTGVKVEIRQHA